MKVLSINNNRAGGIFIPYVVFCEKCGEYHELKEGESVFDFDKCHCGGILRFAESVEDVESSLKTLSSKPRRNFLARKWTSLSLKHKSGIIIGLFLILIGAGLLLPGLVFPHSNNVIQPAEQQPTPLAANISQNVSDIEINIITNGSWMGIL